ncbi:MAG: hypothetical protein A3K06_00960 [Candidatus Doudnabacteria bacterium RIFCSPHIGHO2_01_52_17]|uniref:Glycosyltransferase subfamily 4-like N-terminal domain-containing protein n=1 Tax=Candidatus Doudnabacteria bacterium RIFCSPHIGHO2_01_52_17 TaxID=1817820 RepID=A0A1F5NF95_9BACT|nr:MAG: hypothetical protein A3K06_00960 [Candidatus Doudnabacteria bacterium RIFCSPHIGHO2_01_52_17]
MRVLMISLDRGLLGKVGSGDVIARHQKYAELCGRLDVIVLSAKPGGPRWIGENLRIIPTGSSKLFHWRKAAAIATKLLIERPYDLLITQDFAAPAGEKIRRLFRVPWIVSIHGMFFSREWLKFNPLQWYLFWRIKQAIARADAFRVNNEVIQNRLQTWGIAKPILVQPTAIDIRPFFSDSKPDNKIPRLLYVGRLSAEKNVAMLIRAVKSLPIPFRLEIVGGGAQDKALRELAKNDSRIEFLGQKNFENLPDIYREADIFVLPSDTETFGQVLMQAAAAGCAILATRTAGAARQLEHGRTGVLVDLGDESALRSVLNKLLIDAQLRRQLGENARSAAKKYDSDEAVQSLVSFWKEIAHQ